MMKIVSLNVGKPKMVQMDGKEVETGYYKKPVQDEIYLAKLNFEGDGQAEAYHGGVDKAVCVYPYEHYPYWEQQLNRKLPAVAFGENVTVTGMLETDVHIGDTFSIGQAIVQITQPRRPCHKIAGRHAVKDLTACVLNSGYTGYYLRVLEEGSVGPDSLIERLSIDPGQISVAFANDSLYRNKNNMDDIRRILEVGALSESWRLKFSTKLEKLTASL